MQLPHCTVYPVSLTVTLIFIYKDGSPESVEGIRWTVYWEPPLSVISVEALAQHAADGAPSWRAPLVLLWERPMSTKIPKLIFFFPLLVNCLHLHWLSMTYLQANTRLQSEVWFKIELHILWITTSTCEFWCSLRLAASTSLWSWINQAADRRQVEVRSRRATVKNNGYCSKPGRFPV